jgi:hypothetical protein
MTLLELPRLIYLIILLILLIKIRASSAASERFFSQGALIITKLRNRLNKSTFKKISCLKSWGVFKDKLEEVKKEEKKDKNQDSKEDN